MPGRLYLASPVHLVVLLLTTVLAGCSILYELLIAQTISLLSANTVVWYSVTVGIFLLGMGLGAFLFNLLEKRINSWKLLILTEFTLTFFGALAVGMLHVGHMLFLYSVSWGYEYIGILSFFSITTFLTLIIGVLTGVELPLLMKIGEDLDPPIPSNVTLGTDYLGSLVGAFLFPLILLPQLELLTISLVVASMNIACVLILIFIHNISLLRRIIWTIPAAATVCGLLYGFSVLQPLQQYFLKKYYFYMTASESLDTLFDPMPEMPRIFRVSSPYQKIDLVNDPQEDISLDLMDAFSSKRQHIKGLPENNILFLNGDFQINTSFEEIYHEFFAHVPVIMSGKEPERVLVLGGGDGVLIKELLKYPEAEITHIDLDRELVRVAKTHPVLTTINNRSFHNDRINTIFGDGYHFIRHTDQQWDAIYVDFPAAVDYNLAKLYSREFFAFVKKRIAPGGFVVFDATGVGSLLPPDANGLQYPDSVNDWPVYYHTLRAAGFKTIKPYVTTLDYRDQKVAQKIAAAGPDLLMQTELWPLVVAAQTPAEQIAVQNVLMRTVVHNLLLNHVVSLQQGFIVLALDDESLSSPYRELPVLRHVLNRANYELSTTIPFSFQEEIDYSKVNSIIRPTFPTVPFWQPRIPF